MKLHDKNGSWAPPDGFELQGVSPCGAYLQLTYHQKAYRPNTTQVIHTHVVIVYLNDMGREVTRTQQLFREPVCEPETIAKPVRPWFRFKNGFLLAVYGIWRMITCLKN